MTELSPPVLGLLLRLAAGAALTGALLPLRRFPGWRRAVAWSWAALLATWAATWLDRAVAELAPKTGPWAGQLLLTIAWMLVAVAGLLIFELVVWDAMLQRDRPRPLPRLLLDLLRFVVVVAAVLTILNRVFQVDLTALLVTSTVVSAVIGLALQDTLRNLISGIALQIDPPFVIGDWVRIAGTEGEVIAFNWRTVTLHTREHFATVIPNGKASNEDIINYHRPMQATALDMKVGVAYPHPPGEVKAVLLGAALEAEGVVKVPGPVIYVEEFADFAVVYRVRVWLQDWGAKPRVKDAVMRRIWYRLRRAGMVIPFPIRDVNLRPVAADAADQARLLRQEEIQAILAPLPLLAPLSARQIAELAAASDLYRYSTGEVLFRQGEAGDSLFVVRSGQARVDVDPGDGVAVTIAHREAGEFFGEMSLLTGEVRSATVTATTECDVAVVPRSAVAGLLLTDPGVAEALSETLAARLSERDARLAAAGDPDEVEEEDLQASVLVRIRGFFGL